LGNASPETTEPGDPPARATLQQPDAAPPRRLVCHALSLTAVPQIPGQALRSEPYGIHPTIAILERTGKALPDGGREIPEDAFNRHESQTSISCNVNNLREVVSGKLLISLV
jgi:hypothetical protein